MLLEITHFGENLGVYLIKDQGLYRKDWHSTANGTEVSIIIYLNKIFKYNILINQIINSLTVFTTANVNCIFKKVSNTICLNES